MTEAQTSEITSYVQELMDKNVPESKIQQVIAYYKKNAAAKKHGPTIIQGFRMMRK